MNPEVSQKPSQPHSNDAKLTVPSSTPMASTSVQHEIIANLTMAD